MSEKVTDSMTPLVDKLRNREQITSADTACIKDFVDQMQPPVTYENVGAGAKPVIHPKYPLKDPQP